MRIFKTLVFKWAPPFWGPKDKLCFIVHYFVSFLLKRLRELVALLLLSYRHLVTVNVL